MKPILKVPTHLFGRSVLVVEDEFMVAWDLESTLSAAGLKVLGPVSSVRAALDLIHHSRPDAAILDLNLRGELVTPVAHELRKLKVPFVLSTAYNHLKPSADTVLSDVENIGKPLPSARFIEVLSEMLS